MLLELGDAFGNSAHPNSLRAVGCTHPEFQSEEQRSDSHVSLGSITFQRDGEDDMLVSGDKSGVWSDLGRYSPMDPTARRPGGAEGP